MNIRDNEELYKKVVLLEHALNRTDMFIEPTDDRLPQKYEDELNGIIDPTIPIATIRNYFTHNMSQCIENGSRPAVKIKGLKNDIQIAIPTGYITCGNIDLVAVLQQVFVDMRENIEYSHWNGDYESYYIALRKYPYIRWCIDNQEYKKLAQYIRIEYR